MVIVYLILRWARNQCVNTQCIIVKYLYMSDLSWQLGTLSRLVSEIIIDAKTHRYDERRRDLRSNDLSMQRPSSDPG